ncbi:SDR family oxidoreductase [Arenibacter sp. GZD96]|uniref:SDR family oxidoreductase n=1 Tax=Aurantibrevibacter litoralis TaxID=3106030 RepID=UPI002AFF30F9|nr:SDR family oxidoreductase [Arenibacter sp. GZD-96]MEA1786966.1 SDR family oxidoreductase [Arenibacter sp. GZD-96]
MNQFSSIESKLYVVTGGTGVLGSSISQYLISNGANVILLGRSLNSLEETQEMLNVKAPNRAHIFVGDVMNEKELRTVKQTILKNFGTIDGLINLAGGNTQGATLTPEQSIFDITIEDSRKAVELNLWGTVIPTLIFSELMAKQGYGSVINISSMASHQAISRVLGYSIAKAGIEIFTKWMAHELASKFSDKIRVNALAPGFFIGNQNRKLLTNEDGSYTERSKKVLAKTPMGRFGDASELNGMIHYLLSDASSFVTGSVYEVDGGFSSFSGV